MVRLTMAVDEMAARWQDEAAEAALAGKPKRALYLEGLAQRAPLLVAEASQRAMQSGRAWCRGSAPYDNATKRGRG